MTRTLPFLRDRLKGPPKRTEDPFNILDIEPPSEERDLRGLPSGEDDATGREVKEFYRDATLLITGGTGFLGRVLLQKLLRTFPIKRIYLLVRKKNTQSVEERMEEFFQNAVRLLFLAPPLHVSFLWSGFDSHYNNRRSVPGL